LYYLAGNFYLARNHITASLDYFKKILLDTRKYKAYRSTNNINYYSKLVVDKLINNYPADIIYRFLKQEIIPNYRLGLDEREDENYIFYIMGNLSENLRNREEALFFYKQCEKISDNYNAAEKPFSHTLSLKRLREMGARF
jgi:tetratricopeptide (TPR) repeat protein